MTSVRGSKKDIDYLISEVISNCYTCLYFNPTKNREEIFAIIDAAVELRNNLISKVNHPAEKHNKHLVKKHFTALRAEVFTSVDSLFVRLSEACK